MVPGTMAMPWAFARSLNALRQDDASLQEEWNSADVGCQDVRTYSGRMASWAPCEAAATMCSLAFRRL